MRPSCLDCARKHIAQAMVLIHESKQGYPVHSWYAIGHLAEASDELIAEFPEAANLIRQARLEYMKDNNFKIDFAKLIDEVSKLKSTDSCCTESKKEALRLIRLPICYSCPNFDAAGAEGGACKLTSEPIMIATSDSLKMCPEGHWPQ